ncbi:MAG: hypothetical protein AAB608_00920 [Patescibacteria group bacterium]
MKPVTQQIRVLRRRGEAIPAPVFTEDLEATQIDKAIYEIFLQESGTPVPDLYPTCGCLPSSCALEEVSGVHQQRLADPRRARKFVLSGDN